MKGFSDKKTPTSVRSIFQKFFVNLPEKATYRVKLKILASCHVLLDDFFHGALFAEFLNQWDGFNDSSNQIQDKFIEFYYQLLQRFANSITLIKMVKSQKSYSIRQFQENQNMYYKAINLLNFIFSHLIQLRDLISDSPEEIIYELLLLLWNDTIALYIFIEKLIIEFGQDYSAIQTMIFFQIFELLPDFTKIKICIKDMYQLCSGQKQINQPTWKEISEKKLEDIYKYHQIVKISTTRHKLQQQAKKRYATLTPQNAHQQPYFQNTTLGYFKRLSTIEDPFDNNSQEYGANQMTQN